MKEKILKWCENKRLIVLLSIIVIILSIFIAKTSLASWELNLKQPGNNKITIKSNDGLYAHIKSQSRGSDIDNNLNYNALTKDTNESGVYSTTKTNNNLEVYFYRGKVDNNNILFGGFCWKIVRTTERYGVKLIYNGIPNNGNCNATGSQTAIGESVWNEVVNDNAYVGYMTGKINATNYLEAQGNIGDSKIKTVIDSWYEENLKGTEAEDLIIDSVYCNDRTMESDWSNYKYNDWISKYDITQLGFGSSYNTIFKGSSRVGTAVGVTEPTLVCQQDNDKFTTKAKYGNGKLTYPIALLTADEAVFAGSKGGILENQNMSNPDMYLAIGGSQNFWTMTPHRYYKQVIIYLAVSSVGLNTNEGATVKALVRPVITINGNAKLKTGDGTSSNPYQI